MDHQLSSDPIVIFAEWERVLSERVPMADGTQDTYDFGVWMTCGKDAVGGSVSDIRVILDEYHRSQDPLRKRAQRILQPIAAAASPASRMPRLVEDCYCWAYQPGIAGMGFTVLEETGQKLCKWVLLEAAEKFPFTPTPSIHGSFNQQVEGLGNWATEGGRETEDLVDEMCRRSPAEPLLELPALPVRSRSTHDHRTAIERALAQVLTNRDGTTLTLIEAVRKRLIVESSKGTRGARALLSKDRHRVAVRAAKNVKEAYPTTPPTISRTISFSCGKAGVGSEMKALGITATVYPRFLLYGWLLDAAWTRGGRPEDPEKFKEFIEHWVLGELHVVPEEYRPSAAPVKEPAVAE